ncbi:hypothetical protein Tco_0369102 [Tanacetum coccineum]
MSITDVLGQGWGSPTDWSRFDPRNNGKDRPDQAEDASCSVLTKELRQSETGGFLVDLKVISRMEFEVGGRSYVKVSALGRRVVSYGSVSGKAEADPRICQYHVKWVVSKVGESCA